MSHAGTLQHTAGWVSHLTCGNVYLLLLCEGQIIRVRSAFQIADDNSDHLLDASEFQKVLGAFMCAHMHVA
jgi:hypothetical protein